MRRLMNLLQEGRRREREQALFYRILAGDAEVAGNQATAERLNELLADEQHHVSRLTARIIELGGAPLESEVAPDVPELGRWESVAREREGKEVTWYEAALARVEDTVTRAVLEEILESERHHRSELAGKWMSAAPPQPEERA
jgi:rubrerythrin